MVTEEDRQWMWQQYAPLPRMRLNLGIRRRLAPLLDNDLRKIKVANSLLFTLIGSPIIYYGDEIGMGDNIWLEDRNGVRTPMQWNSSTSAGFSDADPSDFYLPVIDEEPFDSNHINVFHQQNDPNSLFNAMKLMIATHKAHKAFGWGDFEWIDVGSKGVAAYLRTYQDERLLILNNLQDKELPIELPMDIPETVIDILNNRTLNKKTVTLAPYQFLWLAI
jgi:maltose alpha-D-glucosyltransferase/alpha-amylase